MNDLIERDLDERPYTADERRIGEFIDTLTNGDLGWGNDPIGFLLASYSALAEERKAAKAPLPEEVAGLIKRLRSLGRRIGAWIWVETAAALERQAREIERLTGIEDDYLRRHKDACDRFMRIKELEARIAELEAERDNIANACLEHVLHAETIEAETIELAEECDHVAWGCDATSSYDDADAWRTIAKRIRALAKPPEKED